MLINGIGKNNETFSAFFIFTTPSINIVIRVILRFYAIFRFVQLFYIIPQPPKNSMQHLKNEMRNKKDSNKKCVTNRVPHLTP